MTTPQKDWLLYRIDDNGNTFPIATFPTRQQAEEQRTRYEKKGHKQAYLIKKV